MHITQNEIVAIILVLAILWIWFTWDKNTEGFSDLTIPKGKKWGDYVYYEDENEFPVVTPSISRAPEQSMLPLQSIQSIQQMLPIHKKFAKINDVGGMTDTSHASSMGAPFDDTLDFDDSLINKMNNEDNRSQESIVHELPKSHDHPMMEPPMTETSKQILTEKELMPGMEQKKMMEKSLEPQVKQPRLMMKPKSKKNAKKVTEDRYMALAVLLAVLLIGFVQNS